MYAMNDRRYQYRPLSEKTRAAMSRAQRARLGVPDGYCLIYGELVPEDIAEYVREVAQMLARKHSRDHAERAVRGFIGKQATIFRANILPVIDEWVLAYWDHMRPQTWHMPHTNLRGGWFATRYRARRGWQAQFGSYRCFPRGEPVAWTPLLQPNSDSDTRPKEGKPR